MFNAVDILCDVMVYAYYYLQSLLFHSKGAKTSNESIRERVESVKWPSNVFSVHTDSFMMWNSCFVFLLDNSFVDHLI